MKICFVVDLFDSHDDRDDEGEAGSVEEHKSVIMHLLSQVRLGMDLTKVGINFGVHCKPVMCMCGSSVLSSKCACECSMMTTSVYTSVLL